MSNTSRPGFYCLASVHRWADRLTIPFAAGSRQFLKSTNPIIKGREEAWGQESSASLEIVKRVAVDAVIVIPTLLSSIPFVVGQGIKMSVSLVAKKPMVILSDPNDFMEPWSRGNRYSWMTFNVMAMHSLINRWKKARPMEIRMREIVQYIRRHHAHHLTLSFQECFTERATKILVEGLQELYPHIVHSVGKNVFGLNSGLLLMSKKPIEAASFSLYHPRKGNNALAQKGALGVILKLDERNRGVLINTHMEAGGRFTGDATATRQKQIVIAEKLANSLKQIVQDRGNTLLFNIFTGDANSRRYDFVNKPPDNYPEFTRIFSNFYLGATTSKGSTLDDRLLTQKEYQSLLNDPTTNYRQRKRIDYCELEILPHQEATDVCTEVDYRTIDMSDHFPVITTATIRSV